ncbi:ubiquitin domain-containing protein 7SL RNA1-like [Rhodamnia argentea]|uniref:Ubiquitin domain-containing protein 7SL RNA1-like n=1 Tax=Rhodamnia argentea TaxID=178133 RepID=A0A8B8MWH9_9MYRT|nr:ubiquitin domain-containing protein 7SL RNA1-like [Rhodamnia argentea]
MDVIFEPQRGRPFSIEVGFFDTVQDIKEKIQKYQGIPMTTQTLIFNGQVLPDERDVEHCEILQNSHVQLVVVDAASPQNPSKAEEPSPSPSTKLQLNVKSASLKARISVEIDASNTVARLKDKIHEIEGVPTGHLALQVNGMELQDHQSVGECELSDNAEVEVSMKQCSPTTSAAPMSSKKLRVMVLPKCGTKRIAVEVSGSDNVGELRKELQKLQKSDQLHLPQEGYFFIYKQNVMDEDRSFRWHHVAQGDTIEIFNGSVTGGS